MIVTEEEAKTKACCGGIDTPAGPVTADGLLLPHCLGSACMAWRWVNKNGCSIHPRIGYCGKAGTPTLEEVEGAFSAIARPKEMPSLRVIPGRDT